MKNVWSRIFTHKNDSAKIVARPYRKFYMLSCDVKVYGYPTYINNGATELKHRSRCVVTLRIVHCSSENMCFTAFCAVFQCDYVQNKMCIFSIVFT